MISIAALARRVNGVGPQPPKCAEPSFPAISFAAAPPKMKKPRIHTWSDDDQSLFSASSDDENMEYVDAATLAGYGDEG